VPEDGTAPRFQQLYVAPRDGGGAIGRTFSIYGLGTDGTAYFFDRALWAWVALKDEVEHDSWRANRVGRGITG